CCGTKRYAGSFQRERESEGERPRTKDGAQHERATKEGLQRSSLRRRVPSSCGRFYGEEVRRPRQTGLCYSTKKRRRSESGGVEKEPLTTQILLVSGSGLFVLYIPLH
ncbi:unnamed protein product, partial [Ectocarpus sp. 6 AP-2014]